MLLTAVLLLGWPANGVQTQEQQPVAQPKVIDGRIHPELIPDSQAYFIVFNHLSQTVGNPEQEKVWIGHAVGLSDDDTEMLLRIMRAYRKGFDAIVKTYNDANEDAIRTTGQPPDPSVLATFKSKRNELVLATRKDLDATLTPSGAHKFHAYVQMQKSTMVVTLEPGDPPTPKS
jgi:hypothetical protein